MFSGNLDPLTHAHTQTHTHTHTTLTHETHSGPRARPGLTTLYTHTFTHLHTLTSTLIHIRALVTTADCALEAAARAVFPSARVVCPDFVHLRLSAHF